MNKVQIVLLGLLICFFSIPGCSEETMPDLQELDIKFEQFDAAASKIEYEACKTLGNSNAKGINLTRIGCRLVYKDPQSDENLTGAIACFQRAAEYEEPHAKYYLGIAYKKTDPKKAKQFFLEAAEQNVTKAQAEVGRLLALEEKYPEAERWLKKAANNGDDTAALFLGMMFIYMAPDNDDSKHKQGCEYVLSAAQNGNYYAQRTMVGPFHEYFKNDFRWFIKEAKAGNTKAFVMVGMMYEKGVGVERDEYQAMRWYEKAVQEESQMGLTNLYMLVSGLQNRGKQRKVVPFEIIQTTPNPMPSPTTNR